MYHERDYRFSDTLNNTWIFIYRGEFMARKKLKIFSHFYLTIGYGEGQ